MAEVIINKEVKQFLLIPVISKLAKITNVKMEAQ